MYSITIFIFMLRNSSIIDNNDDFFQAHVRYQAPFDKVWPETPNFIHGALPSVGATAKFDD